jgi:hypothetical protein
MVGMDALIHALQVNSWKASGIEDRLLDRTFPFSGHFAPSKEIENALAQSLTLSGCAVGRPIVTEDLLTTPYQEKLSLPFIYAAWHRLADLESFPTTVTLGQNVFLATAPTGKLYPVTYFERLSQEFGLVFDANLLLFYQLFLTSIARVSFAPEADKEWDDPLGVKWGRNFVMTRSLPEILTYEEDATNLASLLLNTVIQSLPFSENFGQLQHNIKQDLLVATLLEDL